MFGSRSRAYPPPPRLSELLLGRVVRRIALVVTVTLLVPVAVVAQVAADADRDAPYPREVVPAAIHSDGLVHDSQPVPDVSLSPPVEVDAVESVKGAVNPNAETLLGLGMIPLRYSSADCIVQGAANVSHDCADEITVTDMYIYVSEELLVIVTHSRTCRLEDEYTVTKTVSGSLMSLGGSVSESRVWCDYGQCGKVTAVESRR